MPSLSNRAIQQIAVSVPAVRAKAAAGELDENGAETEEVELIEPEEQHARVTASVRGWLLSCRAIPRI